MRVVDFIQQMEKQNLAQMLFNKGILSYKGFVYREYYKVFCSFRDAEPFMDRKVKKTHCVEQAAKHCKVHPDTIWNAIKEMEFELDAKNPTL